MTVSVGTFEDLQEQPRPIDENPTMPCQLCGDYHSWRDYWKEKLGGVNSPLWCESCWGELREQAEIDRYKRDHHTLTEFEK